MNIKQLAIEVTKREGKKESVSIAQVGEIMNHIFDVCFELPVEDFIELGQKISKAAKARALKKKQTTKKRK